jgi:outer membrane receptor protein involved in Fe transport
MKKKILAATMICCLWSALTSGQPNSHTIIIKGRIIAENSGDIPTGASVKLKGKGTVAAADQSGVFHLEVVSLPVTLIITHTSFEDQEITVSQNEAIHIILKPRSFIGSDILLESKGIPTRIMDYPSSAELLSAKRIRQLPTTSAYDGLAYSRGIDFNTSSLTMKTPSTRGFNGSGSTRVNQLIDGMDNQAPGLNFFIGHFTGPTETDIESIEILPGASSALYGPGGMNGTILINSKSPFKHQGLSIVAKQGIMNIDKSQRNQSAYTDYSLRWAKAFNKKLAAKIGVQFLSANDWLAADTSNYLRQGTSGKIVPGNRQTDANYDGVNVYGDETSADIYPFLAGALPPGDSLIEHIQVSRTGYYEKDIIDPKTKNIKLTGALHYKLTDKVEAIFMGNWSTGNTVYTDDNRYSLKGINIAQYKIELKHKKWYLRSYTTQEDAGEAHSATISAQFLNEAWKRSFDPTDIPGSWYPQFTGAYLQARMAGADKMTALNIGRAFADQGRLQAGSAQFKQTLDVVRKVPIPGGGLFKEKSQLWMHEGQYTFGDASKNIEVTAGGSFKKYILNSDGTLFIDTVKPIRIYEIGSYVQLTRKILNDKLTLVVSGRFDKNENFKPQFTPRAAALVKLAEGHNLRMSYQTAYRFPGNLSQWIRLDVGNVTLLGGLPWVLNYMNVKEYPVIDLSTNAPLAYKEFKPETMRSFEAGYKGKINKNFLFDVYGYTGRYQDFLGRIGLFQPVTNKTYSIVVNSSNKVRTHGFGIGLDYQLHNNYAVFFNAYSDVITDIPSGFKAYFNAPKYKLNAGFANSGFGKDDRISFNIMLRWQDAFDYEGELANGPVEAFTSIDAQVSYKFPKIKSQVRAGGTNIFNKYYKNAYAHPAVGGLYYAGFAYNIF